MDPRLRLEPLVGVWRRTVDTPTRRAALAALVAAAFVGAHVGRGGTLLVRIAVPSLLFAVVLALVWSSFRRRRALRDPRLAVPLLLRPSAPELAASTLRALRLVEKADAGTLETSPALARAHFERLLDRAPPAAVANGASRRARRMRRLGLLATLVAVAAFAAGPMRIIEGLDVLAARGATAPLPLVWIDEVTIVSHPPGYLRREDRWLMPGMQVREPRGAEVSVRGAPRRPGRDLVLTDGRSEVAFVSDGEGGLVARWTLDRDADLRVAARFGDVLVFEPDAIAIEAIADASPTVVLEGAPRTVRPEDLGGRLELQYLVGDDHGLREVDVVLRAGNREDRRPLARLDGEVRRHFGGYALDVNDPFLRGSYLPVLVTVEARDNQPSELPRWGRSQPITLVPPAIGRPEAERLTGLVAGRDAVVDLLAWQLEGGAGKAEEGERMRRAAAIVDSGLDAARAALPVPEGFAAFVRGQGRALKRLRPGASTVRATEDVALALDAALARLATRDARDVARRLSEVAEEAAAGARQARETEQRSAGVERFDAAVAALRTGVTELGRLGVLGRDLGSVAEGDLDRARRARAAEDLRGAELAARHIAARLRHPTPSFSAKHTGGVESAGGHALDAGEASQADQRFDELAQELERLAQEHASDVGAVERSLAAAERPEDVDALKDEAHRRAAEIARAVADLPVVGGEPGSPRSAAARGREQATAMAQSLERLALGDAVERGREARAAFDEAIRKVSQLDPRRVALDPAGLRATRERLTEHLEWAERELERVRRIADDRARSALSQTAERERDHAERAGNLASRGRNGQSSFPEEVLDRLEQAEGLMRDAARHLDAGHGRQALELQRDAQRLLEQASPGKTTDPGTDRDAGGPRGAPATHGEVPEEAADRSQDFRRRVVEGLGGDRSGRLAPALRRYAEGLLR